MPTHAELVTPERVLYSGEAEFVVLRTDGGEIMFLPNHAPFVAAVDICLLRVAPVGAEVPGSSPDQSSGRPEAEVRAAVHGGFVHVADNRVLLLASVAELAEEVDVERARRALESAEAVIAEGAEDGEVPTVTPEAEDGSEGGILQSPTMLALLQPDDPEVAARRARARLEAAGVLEPASGGGGSS